MTPSRSEVLRDPKRSPTPRSSGQTGQSASSVSPSTTRSHVPDPTLVDATITASSDHEYQQFLDKKFSEDYEAWNVLTGRKDKHWGHTSKAEVERMASTLSASRVEDRKSFFAVCEDMERARRDSKWLWDGVNRLKIEKQPLKMR